MKRILILFVLVLGMAPLFAVQAQQMCFADRRVLAVNIGYVNGDRGPDGGYAVYFRLDDSNRWWSLNNGYNLNDEGRGPALYKMLMTAMAGGYKVTAIDHYYPYCDDVDQIDMHR